jgi:hypothetical protein
LSIGFLKEWGFTSLGGSFAGNLGQLVFPQASVEDGIGDLIAVAHQYGEPEMGDDVNLRNLVGVTLSH